MECKYHAQSNCEGADEYRFRWAFCQLDSLRKCLKLDQLRKALRLLPKTLDITYERILLGIDEEYREDVVKVLQWLCFSVRPVMLGQMVDILAVTSTDKPQFFPDQRYPDPGDILTIDSTLVTVFIPESSSSPSDSDDKDPKPTADSRSATDTSDLPDRSHWVEFRLAHVSIEEYFMSDRIKSTAAACYYMESVQANLAMVQTCLGYLVYFDSPITLFTEHCLGYLFYEYAGESWAAHYRTIDNGYGRSRVDSFAFEFATPTNESFINWLVFFHPEDELLSVVGLPTFRPPLYRMSN